MTPSRRGSRNGSRIADRLVAVVAERCGRFVDELCAALVGSKTTVVRLHPGELSNTRVHVEESVVRLGGQLLHGVAFLDRPIRAWGTGFIAEDESFAAQEWAATWLSVLNHPAVTVLSRPPATVWYSPSEGLAWRDWLEAAGVNTLPLSVSTQPADGERIWLSWIGGQGQPPGTHAARAFVAATVPAQSLTNVYLGGSVIVPANDATPLHAAVDALANGGVRFGRLTCTREGDIVSFTAWPTVPDDVVPQLVPACAEVLDGSLGSR